MNSSTLSTTEQSLINMINNDLKNNPHWAENVYDDDDDPHSEMLIKYVMWGVNDNCSHFLNIVLTNAPEHKLNVLNSFLLSGVVMNYLSEGHQDYSDNLLKRFPNLLNENYFWQSFCQHVHKAQNFQALFEMENLFDHNLVKCKEHAKEEYQSIFNKYDLYKKLDNKLQDKHHNVKTKKI